MTRNSTFLRIPKERVGVLIGPEGKTKKIIEDKFSVELQIDSESGGITVMLKENAQDPSMDGFSFTAPTIKRFSTLQFKLTSFVRMSGFSCQPWFA